MSDDLVRRLGTFVDGIRGENDLRVGLNMCVAIMEEAADALAAKDTALSEMRAELADANAAATFYAERGNELNSALCSAEAQLERARKALEPFGHFSENFQPEDGWSPTDLLTISIDDARLAEISMSCFYAAASALASQG